MQRALTLVAIVAATFALYLSNGELITSYDSAPNSLLAFNTFATGKLDFDDYRGSYFGKLGGAYAFVEAPNGHLTSYFPIGTAIVTLPIASVVWLVARPVGVAPPSPAFEPFREAYEKIAAALVAACSVGLFFACARRIGASAPATIATTIYALATPMWAIASQGLWQHGPVNLAILAIVYALLGAQRSTGRAAIAWLVIAGVFAGLLPVIRPTALLFSIASLAYVAWTFRRLAPAFIIGGIVGVSPGLAWNLAYFHTLAGGYGGNLAMYRWDISSACFAFAGLLASPSRGLFVFAPVLLLAIAGAVVAWRTRRAGAALLLALGAAAMATTVQYAFFREWWGGFTYGPRFLADTVAIATLLIVYVLPENPLAFARAGLRGAATSAAFVVVCLWCITVQFAGANGGAAGSDWNAVPISIDVAPERLWSLADTQIERNVRAAYYRFFPAAPPGTPTISLSAIAPQPSAPGAAERVTMLVHNGGPTTVWGYRSGRYLGQLRVQLTLANDRATTIPATLYLADSLPPGASATAIGEIPASPAPGTYRVTARPYLVGDTPVTATTAKAALQLP